MSAGKIIGYIVAAIAIFFGVIFIWGAFSPEGQPAWLIVGSISALIGFGIIWFVGRQKAVGDEEVKVQIDLTGDIELDSLKCESCGGSLSSDHTSLQEGALVVDCPFCGTHYQITEQPKW
jgi:hypothetical protein